jgi:simple sugar transport system permease protein
MSEKEKKNKEKLSFGEFLAKWGILLTIALMLIGFSVSMPTFRTYQNMITILRAVSIVTIISIGMTMSLTVNGMDLSVGSAATLSNTICMTFFIWYNMGSSVGSTFLAILLSVLICLVVALINIFLIVKLNIPDMLATLATMFMFEGVAMTYAGGGAINENMIRKSGEIASGKVPVFLRTLGQAPWIIIVMIVIVFLAFILLSFTKHGRYMYAVGDNPLAAELSGINVKKYRALAYILSTACAAIGGVLIGARVGNAQINSGAIYLMGSVAAANIGISVAGIGKPNALGTLAGAFLIGILENGLIMASVPYYAVNIFKGIILAVALALNYSKKR